MRTKAKLSLLTLSLMTAASLSLPVFAEGTGGSTSGSSTGSGDTKTTTIESHTPRVTVVGTHESTTGTGSTESSGETIDSKGTETDHHLSVDKLKICQTHETKIDSVMGRIGDRGQKQLDLFTTIATRVETFYTKSGKTLDNYDTLVTAVNTAKDSAQTAVDKVKADKASFKCDGTDPSGAASSFKTDLQTEITALKNYRTAIKNLIVGVKSVVDTKSSQSSGATH